MKTKYMLIYEWEDNKVDITSYAKDNNVSIKDAIKKLIEWNMEEIVERMNDRAENILPVNYKVQFIYNKES